MAQSNSMAGARLEALFQHGFNLACLPGSVPQEQVPEGGGRIRPDRHIRLLQNLACGNHPAVFVKGVVRRFHAASLISGALISFSGFSQTGPAGCQLRVLPDQRSGFCARAFA